MKQSTIDTIRELGVDVVEVNFEKSTKTKALNFAMTKYDESKYEMVVILDADNHMCPDFLNNMNKAYNLGHIAIQGQRAAKNSVGSMSILDGLSEDLNNHIYCKGQYNLGGSSRLSGSGMAFSLSIFKKILGEIEIINGFDKYLELAFVSEGHRILYLPEAIVLDEKVSKEAAFKTQRTRWLAAQYICFKSNLGEAFRQLLLKGNWGFFQKVMLWGIPPKLILLPFLGLAFLSSLIFSDANTIIFFCSLLLLFFGTYALAIPKKYLKASNIKVLLKLPGTILLTITALLSFNKAKNKFLHTPHDSVHEVQNQI